MFHYTKAAFRVGPSILFTYLFYLRKWAKNVNKYPREKRMYKVVSLAKKISRALNVDYQVFGLENIPSDGVFCLVCNHMSAFDPLPVMINVDKPLTFVGKKELKKVPMLNKAIDVLEGEYMDRDNLRQSLKIMLKVEDSLRNGDKNWMIYPEGTRIRDQMLPVASFHHGTFRPASKAGVPIIPVAMYGSFRVLKTKPQFKRYPIYVSILKPLMPSDYANMNTSDIATLTHDAIQREITYHLRPLDHKTMSERKEKNYRFNAII